jgi:hypothetical protein
MGVLVDEGREEERVRPICEPDLKSLDPGLASDCYFDFDTRDILYLRHREEPR